MSDPKLWTVFVAARYIEGVVQESFDMQFQSGGHPLMVEWADYERLRRELAEYQSVTDAGTEHRKVVRLERELAEEKERHIDNLSKGLVAETILEEQLAEARRIYPRLASAWFYGHWKAETANERDIQAIMESQGWWPWTNEQDLLDAIRAAEQDGTND